jgi:hypothetical protein
MWGVVQDLQGNSLTNYQNFNTVALDSVRDGIRRLARIPSSP